MLDGLVLPLLRRQQLERAVSSYERWIDKAGEYLHSRGISRDAAVEHRLGYVEEPTMPEHERFRGWLAIPYLTAAAGVVRFKFRRLDDSEGTNKYDGPAGDKARLYNSRVLAEGGDVVAVCEGELDALLCTSVLRVPAVGTPGTTWLDYWPRAFGDYERVLVIADHDVREDGSSPGIKHAKKVQAALSGSELILPPSGLDLGEWVAQDGPQGVRERLGV